MKALRGAAFLGNVCHYGLDLRVYHHTTSYCHARSTLPLWFLMLWNLKRKQTQQLTVHGVLTQAQKVKTNPDV